MMRSVAFLSACLLSALLVASFGNGVTAAFTPMSGGASAPVRTLHRRKVKQQEQREKMAFPFSSSTNKSVLTASSPGAIVEEQEKDNNQDKEKKSLVLPNWLKVFLSVNTAAVATSTYATFFITNVFSLSPIAASGIVGLLAAILSPNNEPLALASLCGSFAGMASTRVIPSHAGGILLGLGCAATLQLFNQQRWLIGYGGRLGLIAQISCTLQFAIQKYLFGSNKILGNVAASARIVDWSMYNNNNIINLLVSRQFVTVFLGTALGASFMRLWKQIVGNDRRRWGSTCAAVAMTGILAHCLTPASIAGPAYCGSFVAMAAPSILGSDSNSFADVGLLGASLLAAVVQCSMKGFLLGGWGGRLGTAAFVGVALYYNVIVKSLSLLQKGSSSETD